MPCKKKKKTGHSPECGCDACWECFLNGSTWDEEQVHQARFFFGGCYGPLDNDSFGYQTIALRALEEIGSEQ